MHGSMVQKIVTFIILIAASFGTLSFAEGQVSSSLGVGSDVGAIETPLQLRLISTPFVATVGQEFAASFQAAGGVGPLTFKIDGSVPPGLLFSPVVCESLSADNCTSLALAQVTGTPTQAGNFTFTVSATDRDGVSVANTFTLTVHPLPVSVSGQARIGLATDSALVAIVDQSFNAVVQANGGLEPYSWDIVSGDLPQGMLLSEPPLPLVASCPVLACGNVKRDRVFIQGIPERVGQFSFVLKAQDANKVAAEQGFVITVLGVEEAGSLGFDNSNTDVNSAFNVERLNMLAIPEGTTFKAAADPTVYYMARNGKQAYTSFEMLQLWNVPVSDIVIVEGVFPPDDPSGAFVRFPENALVKSKSSPIVYNMQNGSLRAFASMAALRRGRAVIKITTVPQGDIEFHQPFGEPIK